MNDRTPLIAGNWKMNLSIAEANGLVKGIAEGISDLEGVEVLVAPPFTSLGSVRQAIGQAKIYMGAQNMSHEMAGAFTGEISGRMLQEAGVTHVILGHSERRTLYGETNQDIDLKVKAAFFLGLVPIVCIGETLEERESKKTFDVIRKQLDESLYNLRMDQRIPPTTILAYEPVWAIGTGKTATPDQAQEVHAFIRTWIAETFGANAANPIRILYGGSVKASNASELMAKPDIDGALVGGASLKADDFLGIINFGK
jgi:triosephosphate isomerase